MSDYFYNIIGSKILIPNNSYKRYRICLNGYNRIYVYSSRDIISLIDLLTKTKYRFIIDEEGFETVIFRKHIVKITEVK